jgi:hypothetical protein
MAAPNIPQEVESVILNTVAKRSEGASLNEIIAAFAAPPDRFTAQRWVAALCESGRLRIDKSMHPSRFITGSSSEDQRAQVREPVPEGERQKTEGADLAAGVQQLVVAITERVSPTLVDRPANAEGGGLKSGPETSEAKSKNPVGATAGQPVAGATAQAENLRRVSDDLAEAATEGIGRHIPGGLTREMRLLLMGAIGSALIGFLSFASRYPWSMSALSLLSVAAMAKVRTWKTRSTLPACDPQNRPDALALFTGLASRWGCLSRRARYLVGAGVAVLVSGVGIGIDYYRSQQHPSLSAIAEYLASTLAPLPVHVADPEVTYVGPGTKLLLLNYRTRIETTQPLYHRIENPVGALHTLAPTETTAITAAALLLSGPNGERLRTAIATPPPVGFAPETGEGPFARFTLLTTATPAGFSVIANGMLNAWREDRWKLGTESGGVDRSRFQGEPRPSGATVFVMDQPAEASRLRTLLAECAAYAGKVQAEAARLATGDVPPLHQAAGARPPVSSLSAVSSTVPAKVEGPAKTGPRSPEAPTSRADAGGQSSAGLSPVSSLPPLEPPSPSTPTTNTAANPSAISSPNPRATPPSNSAVASTTPSALASTSDASPLSQPIGRAGTPLPAASASAPSPVTRLPAVGLAKEGPLSPEPLAPSPVTRLPAVSSTVASAKVEGLAKEGLPAVGSAKEGPQSPEVLPPLPRQEGAYVRVGAGWVPLPLIHNYVVRSSARGLAGIVSKIQHVQDAVAGKSSDNSAPIFGNLMFDGRESVPVVPGKDVVIAYVGPLTPLTAEQLVRNPELRDYPVIELAPLKTDQRGDRYTPLYEIAPGVVAFGPGRVAAAIELTERSVIIFRCTAPLPFGRYALSCGPKCYELAVQ